HGVADRSRRAGNVAAHEWGGDHHTALHQLRMARELAIWFQRTFGNNRKFDPGPFVPPPEPTRTAAAPDPALHAELERLRAERASDKAALAAAAQAVAEAEQAAAVRTEAAGQAAAAAERKAAEDMALLEAM